MELAGSVAVTALLAGFWSSRTRSSVRFLDFSVKVVRHTKCEFGCGRLWKSGLGRQKGQHGVLYLVPPIVGFAQRVYSRIG